MALAAGLHKRAHVPHGGQSIFCLCVCAFSYFACLSVVLILLIQPWNWNSLTGKAWKARWVLVKEEKAAWNTKRKKTLVNSFRCIKGSLRCKWGQAEENTDDAKWLGLCQRHLILASISVFHLAFSLFKVAKALYNTHGGIRKRFFFPSPQVISKIKIKNKKTHSTTDFLCVLFSTGYSCTGKPRRNIYHYNWGWTHSMHSR